jgi:CBS domain-containing protein
MKLETHIKNSLKKYGVEGRDIHEWIDAHFEHDKFNDFLQTGILPDGWNPYEHRIHRHCIEAMEECLIEFQGKYSDEEIKAVFKSHVIDDYRGCLPNREDFQKKEFHDKYHKF